MMLTFSNICFKYLIKPNYFFSGLLVEPNAITYRMLREKQRKAYSINVCLSQTLFPTLVDFINADSISGDKGTLLNFRFLLFLNNLYIILFLENCVSNSIFI